MSPCAQEHPPISSVLVEQQDLALHFHERCGQDLMVNPGHRSIGHQPPSNGAAMATAMRYGAGIVAGIGAAVLL